jgi:hypothetical protein
MALQTAVPVERADEALRADVEQKRVVLMAFYTAGLPVHDRDEEKWQRSIARVQTTEPREAHYAWVIGRD